MHKGKTATDNKIQCGVHSSTKLLLADYALPAVYVLLLPLHALFDKHLQLFEPPRWNWNGIAASFAAWAGQVCLSHICSGNIYLPLARKCACVSQENNKSFGFKQHAALQRILTVDSYRPWKRTVIKRTGLLTGFVRSA